MATRNELNQLGMELIESGMLQRKAALILFDLAAERTNLLDLLKEARKHIPSNSDGLGIRIDATLSIYANEAKEEAERFKLRTESVELPPPPKQTDASS